MPTLRVGIVQMQMTPDIAANTAKALDMTAEAAQQGANVVCLPELFRSPYFCQTEDAALFDLAEKIPGPTTDAFAEIAAAHDIAIVISLFEERAPGLYHNTAAVVDGKRGYLGMYRKMHIPDDPQYYEKFYFTPGDLGFQVFETAHAKLGTLICWDQWYPEAARLTAMRGAEVLFYPTAIGWLPEDREPYGAAQHDAWQTAQRAHAIANGCFVVAVNRTGFEPRPGGGTGEGIQFWGQSFVVAPDGQLLYQAPADDEAIAVVDLDLTQMKTLRHGWPFFRDRRIDAYQELTKRFID